MEVSTSDFTPRFAEYYRRHGVQCQILNGTLWITDNRAIVPVGPACRNYTISHGDARTLLSNSRSARLVTWTDGFDPANVSGQWYAVVCKKWVDLDAFSRSTRKENMKGLRRNEVRKVDAGFIARNGYDVHLAANARYHRQPKTRDRFVQSMLVAEDFADVIDFWAVFHQDELVGYCQVHLYGDSEAEYAGMAFHPGYFKHNISHALIRTIDHWYLRERNVKYTKDGFRAIVHPTESHDFAIRLFGHERIYTRLYVQYRWPLGVAMALPSAPRDLLAKLSPSLAALNSLHEARSKVWPSGRACTSAS
jgi:hypothetical protein